MTRLTEALTEVPVVGIARRCPARHAAAVGTAAARSGLRVIELTMDAPDASDAIAAAVAVVGDDVVVGAGTVRNAAAVDAAIAAGATFLVAPGFDPDLVRRALDAGVEIVPGALTPTEIDAASRLLGRTPAVCKLFPAGALGPGYLAAIREPFADVSFLCTGGINAGNARAFLDAGALAVGVGGGAFPASALQDGDTESIESALTALLSRLTS